MSNFRIYNPNSYMAEQLAYYQSAEYKTTVNKEYLQDNPEIITTRTFDGASNNLITPEMGSAGSQLGRKAPSAYADGIGSMVNRSPTPRIISNDICATNVNTPNSLKLSNMLWMWGQFLDHEVDLTPTDSNDPANMTTPPDDQYPNYTILFNRSAYKGGVTTPREQITEISSYIDATNVYGSDTVRSMALRRLDGTGKLTTFDVFHSRV